MKQVDIPIDSIIVNGRRRDLNQDKVNGLAQSISEIGLINPVTLAEDNKLLAGLHRLEAARVLHWTTIPAIVLAGLDALQTELAEIDENLIRNELTPLQQGDWLVRRDAILLQMGQRWRGDGDNQHTKTGGEFSSPPPKSTADIANEVGLSERVAQQRKQIANKIAPEVKEEIYGTELEEKATELLLLARLPQEQQMEVVEQIKTGKAKTVKESKKKINRQKQIEAIETTTWPQGKYHVIAIDPAWSYDNRPDDSTHRAANPYPSMTLEEIKALAVPGLALDDCILWLWTTNAFMEEAHQVARHWGFTKKTILTWVKDNMGTGDWLRGQTEHCLMCIKGKPVVNLTNQTTVIHGPLREHSRKPDSFYELVEELCPGKKIELFARQKRTGWEAHGNETDKF